MKSDDKTFVVVSDFHSNRWPLEKVKRYYTNEYDVVYILGDATERGSEKNGKGGVKLLIDIMGLSNENVVYVPGNHDDFVYSYMTLKSRGLADDELVFNIYQNGGEETVNDIDYLYNNNKDLFNELYNWLGNLPLQVKHDYDGVTYNLAHAFFNEKIYKADPKFSLKKLNRGEYRELAAKDILWFRKGSHQYDPSALPDVGSKIIIGHTPSHLRRGVNLDLRNQYGRSIKVICVDGGLTFGNPMLKYVAGQANEDETLPNEHKYVIPKRSILNSIRKRVSNNNDYKPTRIYEGEPRLVEEEHVYNPINMERLKDIIISTLISNPKALFEFEQEIKYNFFFKGNSYELDRNINPNGIVNRIFNDSIYKEQILADVKKELEKIFGEVNRNIFDKVLRYFIIMLGINHIYESFIPEEGKFNIANQVTGFLEEENPEYITTHNNARAVAKALGAQRIKEYFGIAQVLDKDGNFVQATPESYLARIKDDMKNPTN